MSTMDSKVRAELRRLWLKSMHDFGEEREEGIHVTDLVTDCLRQAYYRKRLEQLKFEVMDQNDFFNFFIGRAIHAATVMSENHEKKMKLKIDDDLEVIGKPDEVVKVYGKWVIVDKKSVSSLPSRGAYEHHRKQIYYYAYMLRELKGITASYGYLIYIEKGQDKYNRRWEDDIFRISKKDIDDAGKELKTKARLLKDALDNKMLPKALDDRLENWRCRYCDFYSLCAGDVNV